MVYSQINFLFLLVFQSDPLKHGKSTTAGNAGRGEKGENKKQTMQGIHATLTPVKCVLGLLRRLLPLEPRLLSLALHIVRVRQHAVRDTLPEHIARALGLLRSRACALQSLVSYDVFEETATHYTQRQC